LLSTSVSVLDTSSFKPWSPIWYRTAYNTDLLAEHPQLHRHGASDPSAVGHFQALCTAHDVHIYVGTWCARKRCIYQDSQGVPNACVLNVIVRTSASCTTVAPHLQSTDEEQNIAGHCCSYSPYLPLPCTAHTCIQSPQVTLWTSRDNARMPAAYCHCPKPFQGRLISHCKTSA
jgi:hypothetical protein